MSFFRAIDCIFCNQDKILWEEIDQAVKENLSTEPMEKALSEIHDEVMEEYYNSPKCGDANYEKSWEQELVCLLQQIKNGFVV